MIQEHYIGQVQHLTGAICRNPKSRERAVLAKMEKDSLTGLVVIPPVIFFPALTLGCVFHDLKVLGLNLTRECLVVEQNALFPIDLPATWIKRDLLDGFVLALLLAATDAIINSTFKHHRKTSHLPTLVFCQD